MNLNRRHFTIGLGAIALTSCGAPARRATGGGDGLQPVPNSSYDAWVAGFERRAEAQGFSKALLNDAFRGAGYLPGVVERDRNQVEFRRTFEDYLAIAVSDERVAKGRAAFARERSTLEAIEARYGVDKYIVTAIWGLESFYGERKGDIPVISATSTLAFDGRRGSFFESQLVGALRILQAGDVPAARMVGSWAGAMGHTQFIPTSYLAFAVDFTGDGRRDIWADDPSDALASTAAYLDRNGWQQGVRWGNDVSSGGLQPQPGGPRFNTTANFAALKRYNNSDSYALGVGLLADRIAGAGPYDFTFPPDQYGLVKSDRIALQNGLTARGFDTGGADGVIGPNTREAIRGYQAQQGLPVTGDPSQALLAQLR